MNKTEFISLFLDFSRLNNIEMSDQIAEKFYSLCTCLAETNKIHNLTAIKEEKDINYDIVISNTPFFTEDTLSPDIKRSSARNTSSLSFESLFDGVSEIITPNGLFAMITPAESYTCLAQIALLKGFYLRRLTWVVTIDGAEPKRVLTEWGRVQTQYTIDSLVVANRNGSLTEEYKSLTKEFYL